MKKFRPIITITLLLVTSLTLAFAICGCNKSPLKYEERGDKAYAVTASNTNISGDIVVPATYNGKQVVLNEHAFENCKNIDSITLSEGIKSISMYSFKDCHKKGNSFMKLSIPVSLTDIAPLSFSDYILYSITYAGTSDQLKQIEGYTYLPKDYPTGSIIICTDGNFKLEGSKLVKVS